MKRGYNFVVFAPQGGRVAMSQAILDALADEGLRPRPGYYSVELVPMEEPPTRMMRRGRRGK